MLFYWNSLAVSQTGDDSIYRIHISDVSRHIYENILGIPKSVDCTIKWELLENLDDNWKPVDESLMDNFQVECISNEVPQHQETSENINGNFYTFEKRMIGKRYGFVVKGILGTQVSIKSDTAWVVTGKLRADGEKNAFQWHYYIPFNGRIPLALIGRAKFFEEATKAGKVAFHLIWNFFLAGMFIWLFYCVRYLRIGFIFPVKKGLSLGGGYDEIYLRRESPEFRSILNEWRDIIKKANENVRLELGHGSQVNIADIEGANAKYWRDEGSAAISGLIERIDRPGMNRHPAVRIIRAGLENHELGGFHWVEVSREVDRAIENRASSEIEGLRRKTHLDWLWNLGTLAPLVGLFGTATGISNAFSTLTYLPTDITQTELVKRLAAGIYEALWTTIEGLFVGLVLMLFYYFYNNKMSWIYSKWEELYVYVSEKL
jgi:biopolymer transport protein ExbB/TolQ